ncbi:MAG: TVP38/TMEM64 family protein [Ruminococcus sp.]|nr:TVP38/TMEM64 family protein [Ruminococcus sp.]
MKKVLKISIYVIVIAVIAVLIYYLIPFVKLLLTEEGRAVINDTVQSCGKWAPLIFVGIEIIQIVAAVIPGAPIEIMSGVLFGSFWGIVWCVVGVYIGTVIVFTLVRKFGRPIVYKFFPQEKLEAIKLFNDEKKLALTAFILLAIPGTPKDFITYIAGLTKINPFKFFFIAAAARTPSMAVSVFMGANLGKGQFMMSFILLLVVIALAIAGYFIKNKYFDKKLENKSDSSEKSDADFSDK